MANGASPAPCMVLTDGWLLTLKTPSPDPSAMSSDDAFTDSLRDGSGYRIRSAATHDAAHAIVIASLPASVFLARLR